MRSCLCMASVGTVKGVDSSLPAQLREGVACGSKEYV